MEKFFLNLDISLKKNQFLGLTQSKTWQYFTTITLVGGAYFLAGQLAISIPGVNNLASSVWPAAGISQAGLLLFGMRVWPGVGLGAFLFNIIAIKQPLLFGFAGAFGALMQAMFAVYLLRCVRFRKNLDRLIDVAKLLFLGATFATQISCTVGAISMCLAGQREWSLYWQTRWEWWLGDAMGVLIITPLLLILFQNKSKVKVINTHKNQKFNKQIYAVVWLILLVGISWIVFGSKTDVAISRYPLEYLPFPLIIWSAIQFGQRGAVIAPLIVSSIAIWGGSQGGGPFLTKAQNITEAILFLQAFMGVITITSLLLAATVAERASAEESLRQNEIKYRELVQNANSIILRMDVEGNITFFNEFAQHFFGYTEEEILGKNAIGTIIPPLDSAGKDLAAMLNEFFHYPEKYSRNENENIRRNGERVWVAWSNKPMLDEQGKVGGLLCIGTDITARRRAELALKNLNEELEIRVEERTNALKQTLQALQYQQEKSERLLLNILPETIADKLKEGNSTIADSFADATVLFADIVGFTQLSSRISPSELVKLLNQIFSAFDRLAEKHGLEKIKTIGDAYMVVGGLPTPRRDHAEAIAEMALDMQREIAQFSTTCGQPFRMRIGINSGPVIAGVIGIKKFIYDLWGDTVNTASRMESHGLPGSIHVTTSTYELLKHKYSFENRGLIKVKGKGEMNTYFLIGQKYALSRV